jgi:sugar phosphate isomerase/epimerase
VELHRADLICAVATLGRPSPRLDLATRLEVTAAAGFRYIGWSLSDYELERAAGRSDADIRAMLSASGVGVAELEFLTGWMDSAPATDWRATELAFYALADLVGARHLNCGGSVGARVGHDEAVERFAGMCDRAAQHGLRVAIEFMPWTVLPDAESAWSIIEGAGRPNGGLLLDTWHYFRGAADPSQLLAVPPEQIVVVQLNDSGPRREDLWEESLHSRGLPGESDFALTDLIESLDRRGVDAPVSIEVFSDELFKLAPADIARRIYDSSATVLARARGGETRARS